MNSKIAITNAKIITMEGKDYEQGTLLFAEGKILALGESIEAPAEFSVLEAEGRYLLPGLIDAHTHVGIVEEIYQQEGDDLNEFTNPLTPELRALDGINPVDPAFKDALSGGVTGVMIAPGSANVLGGMTTFLKTCSGNLKEKTVIAESGLKAAFGENPKRVYAEQKKMPRISSRPIMNR